MLQELKTASSRVEFSLGKLFSTVPIFERLVFDKLRASLNGVIRYGDSFGLVSDVVSVKQLQPWCEPVLATTLSGIFDSFFS